ncbi:triose-phosphate isomerase [Methylotenera sp. N17]|jgi:triosephosphate isomerase|uniref:triose-phosphate isomerase n=1 Tax=Methylotenera sp. N17 TaxID=1502761 RepID=UPI0009DEEDD8|nr:triose-phosphate isomerase [Methylotenera sp. N17]
MVRQSVKFGLLIVYWSRPLSVHSHQSTPQKIVIANWKMHGSLKQNEQLLRGYLAELSTLKHTQVVVCVPYPYLAQAQQLLSSTPIAWGAQNMGKFERGAYTGEVSAEMLLDFGVQYVILGHSERSTAYCESDENIADKFMTAKQHGLTPVLCVGETLIEREAGVMEMVVGKQLDTIIRQFGAGVFAHTIISYEPIWAIGTGLAATPEQAKTMHAFIRYKLLQSDASIENTLKILYGGSVNPQNAVQLFSVNGIDGGLVGKCSLQAQDFVKICQAAEDVSEAMAEQSLL